MNFILLFPAGRDQTTTTPPTEDNDGRLPRNVKPVHYLVELFPDLYGDDPQTFKFSGYVWIRINCVSRTNSITLNINKLDLVEKTVNFGSINKTGEAFNVVRYEIDTKWQFLTLHLDGTLNVDTEYLLQMNFTGALKSDFAGFYLSTFRLKETNRYSNPRCFHIPGLCTTNVITT